IFGEVRFGKSLDAIVASFHSAQHPLEPPLLPDAFRYLGAGPVVAVEREGKVFVKLRPIPHVLSSQIVEYLNRRAHWIFGRLYHQRWYSADEHSFGDAF